MRGEIVHVDLLRVNMNETIHTTVVLELTGADDAPGVTEGGVLSQETRELNIEALPGDIPDSIVHDVSGMQINDTLTLSAVTVPDGITLLDDLEETVIATITPPTLEPVEEEIETETELVGEGEEGEDRGRSRRGVRRVRRVLGRRVLKFFSSTPVDWLIVGLGNPGPGYAETPHNVGFKVAEELARRWDLPKAKKKFAGELTEGRTVPGGPRVALLKPQTYMNEAGRSAGPARGSFKLELDHVLVLHDEIDLPFGEIRTRLGGGLAGHNGLKSLKRELGSPDFHRVRIGVGRPDSTDPDIVAAYVLGRWQQPKAEVADLIGRAADEAERISRDPERRLDPRRGDGAHRRHLPGRRLSGRDAGRVPLRGGRVRPRALRGSFARSGRARPLRIAFDAYGRVFAADDAGVDELQQGPRRGERYFGCGERTAGLEKTGSHQVFWNVDPPEGHTASFNNLYTSIPFVLSLLDGLAHGLFLDYPGRVEFDLAQGIRVASPPPPRGPFVYYVFAGPTPRDVLAQYTELTGRISLPPLWALGNQQSKWGYEDADEVRAIARATASATSPATWSTSTSTTWTATGSSRSMPSASPTRPGSWPSWRRTASRSSASPTRA